MHINSSEFVISNTDYKKCPEGTKHEFAFIGRSNVGKSSLINMFLQHPDLAKTSSKPGKTLLINHFIINDDWYVVDLPGYGYARTSKVQREKLRKIIESYILFRPQLTNLFVLVDSRHEPQKIDLEFMEWLGESAVPFSIIFTKCDKLGTVALKTNIDKYKNQLLETWETLPPIFITSGEKGTGREELLNYIEEIMAQVDDIEAME